MLICGVDQKVANRNNYVYCLCARLQDSLIPKLACQMVCFTEPSGKSSIETIWIRHIQKKMFGICLGKSADDELSGATQNQ